MSSGCGARSQPLLEGRASVVIDAHFQRGHPRRDERRMSSGKRALITGGSGGIGSAICRRLARDGHHVYVHAHRGAEMAARVVGEIPLRAGGWRSVGELRHHRGRRHARGARRRCSRRARSRSSSTTPACTMMPVLPGMSAQRVAPGDRRVRQRLLQRHPAAAAADDPHPLGTHRERLLDRRPDR